MSLILGGLAKGFGGGLSKMADQRRQDEQRQQEINLRRELLAEQRAYDQNMLNDTRAYSEGVRDEQRSYNEGLAAKEAAMTQEQATKKAAFRAEYANKYVSDPATRDALVAGLIDVEDVRKSGGKKPELIQLYEYAQKQGFEGSILDYDQSRRKASANNTTVNVAGEAVSLPKPPAGQDWRRNLDGSVYINRDTGTGELVNIPGGEKAREAAAEAERREFEQGGLETSTDIVTNAAKKAKESAEKRNFGRYGTSVVGTINPWSDSAELYRQVEVLKSQAKVANLNDMRRKSKTGGALGSVTENELKMLADMSGALDPNSADFYDQLQKYEQTLLEIIHGREAGQEIYKKTREANRPRRRKFNPNTGEVE